MSVIDNKLIKLNFIWNCINSRYELNNHINVEFHGSKALVIHNKECDTIEKENIIKYLKELIK